MMKKLFTMMAVAMIALTGCGEAPTAILEPEMKETIIVENIITENVINEKLTWEEAKELYYHPYWEDMSNEALHYEWWCEYKDFDEESYTEEEIWKIRFMLNELNNRVEEDGWIYNIDIDDDNFEAFKALVKTRCLMSEEFINTLQWNLHDIYEYGHALR